ncbi:RNA polymerase I associated factor, A49-like protein [Melampsora americana]|nr:RNA polymerase I associated factor, A49-like protein [Melampsora americana]
MKPSSKKSKKNHHSNSNSTNPTHSNQHDQSFKTKQINQECEMIIKLSGEQNKGNYLGPALVKFPDVKPDVKTSFNLYGHKLDSKSEKILVGESDQLEFESNRQSNQEIHCTYLIGLHSNQDQTLTLFPTSFHELRPKVKQLKDAVHLKELEEEGEEGEEENQKEKEGQGNHKDSRKNLGNTFGSKKARRAIQAAARDTIDPESMMHVQNHLQESISTSSKTLTNSIQEANRIDHEKPIPPYHLKATSPKEVYKLSDLVSNLELNSIPISHITYCASPEEAIKLLPNSNSNFIKKRIESCWNRYPEGKLNKKEERRLRILIYINYLLKFYQSRYKLKKRESLKDCLSSKSMKASNQSCPDLILDGLLKKFTETELGHQELIMTTFTEKKLLSYLCTLCLIHEEYTCDISELAEDLKEDKSSLNEIFRSLGCQIEKLSSGELTVRLEEAKKLGKEIKEIEKQRLARLSVPLIFPEPRKKRQRK